jgi:hypothetical protein
MNIGSKAAGAALFAATLLLAGGASAQDEVLDGGQDWHPFSRSATRIYMADMKSMVADGDVSRVTLAVLPVQADAGDYTHNEEVVEFRCGPKQSRSTVTIEYGADGAVAARYDDVSEWDAYNPNGRDGFLAGLVCDGNRANPPTWPSIKAWVDGGRR